MRRWARALPLILVGVGAVMATRTATEPAPSSGAAAAVMARAAVARPAAPRRARRRASGTGAAVKGPAVRSAATGAAAAEDAAVREEAAAPAVTAPAVKSSATAAARRDAARGRRVPRLHGRRRRARGRACCRSRPAAAPQLGYASDRGRGRPGRVGAAIVRRRQPQRGSRADRAPRVGRRHRFAERRGALRVDVVAGLARDLAHALRCRRVARAGREAAGVAHAHSAGQRRARRR